MFVNGAPETYKVTIKKLDIKVAISINDTVKPSV